MPPNGVSTRLPPAKGLAGSAVWQLAQLPVSVSVLPRSIVSFDGSARARPRLNAVHKTTVARIAHVPNCRTCIDRSLLGLQYTRNLSLSVTSFRDRISARHNPKSEPAMPARSCVLLPRVFLPQIY